MSTDDHPSFDEVSGRIKEDVDLIRETLQRETEELRRAAGGFIQQHPYQAAGAAFALGFLLSGGLVSKATVRAFSFGSRFLIGRLIRELVAGAGVGFLFSADAVGTKAGR